MRNWKKKEPIHVSKIISSVQLRRLREKSGRILLSDFQLAKFDLYDAVCPGRKSRLHGALMRMVSNWLIICDMRQPTTAIRC